MKKYLMKWAKFRKFCWMSVSTPMLTLWSRTYGKWLIIISIFLYRFFFLLSSGNVLSLTMNVRGALRFRTWVTNTTDLRRFLNESSDRLPNGRFMASRAENSSMASPTVAGVWIVIWGFCPLYNIN